MKRLFSGLVLFGIFLFGVSEWGKSIEKSYLKENKPRGNSSIPRATFGSAGLPLVRRQLASPLPELSPLELATQYLERNRERWGIKAYHDLRPVEFKTPLATYVRFSVLDNENPILDMGIELEISNEKRVVSVENTYRGVERAEQDPKLLSVADVLGRYRTTHDIDESNLNEKAMLYVPVGSPVPEWVYVISGREKVKRLAPTQLVIRAKDGALLAKHHSRSEFK